MINAVLLEGFLTKEKFAQASEEIGSLVLDEHFIQLVIKSEGGDVASAMEFVEEANRLPAEFLIKIYQASSVAAYIALALVSRDLEMKKDAILGIHRGEFDVSPTLVSPEGKLDESLLIPFRNYDKALREVLDKAGLSQDEKLMSELYASDWLRLTAQECLDRSIVNRLF